MATMVLETEFAAWLREEMTTRRLGKSQLARYIGTGASTVGAWLNEGRVPRPELCRKLAEFFHVPEQLVLSKAGHLAAEEADATPLPAWLVTVFEPLTREERDVVVEIAERTAQGLLALRETRTSAGDQRGPESPPPQAPPPSARRRPRTRGPQGESA